MTAFHRFGPSLRGLVLVLAGLSTGALRGADDPRVQELRTQRVGDTTYFHVRFATPADMETVAVGPDTNALTRQPRLVPADGKARAVYHRYSMPAPGGA